MRLNPYLLVLAAAGLTAAKQVGYFESSSCADPDGFESCNDDADEWYADCINNRCAGQNIDCHNVCECVTNEHKMRCTTSSCWNKVYSCEYQLLVADYTGICLNPDIDNIPFWPPPDNADGSCNCNLGKVNKAQVLVNEAIEVCSDGIDAFNINDEKLEWAYACLCCGYSGLLSSLPSFCPRLDPAEIDFDGAEELLAANMPGDMEWAQCTQYMQNYDCGSDFSFPSNMKYYGPGQIPDGGTETLENEGALTTPVSATVTWALGGGSAYTVTAVSTDAAVPTDDSTVDSDSDSEDDDDDTQSDEGSDGGDGDGDDAEDDAAVHGMTVSPLLFGLVMAVIGAVCVL